MSRFTRQARLADVGVAGQARLEAARVGLATTGAAAELEAHYLRAAGLTVTDDVVTHARPDLGLRHAAAREVANGAYAALLSIRQVLST